MNNVLERMNNVKMCSGVQFYFANCSFVLWESFNLSKILLYWEMVMKQEVKEKWFARTCRLLIRYAPSAIARNAQFFYFICQKLCFCDDLRTFHWAISIKNIKRKFYFCKKIRSCLKPKNYDPQKTAGQLNIQGNPIRIYFRQLIFV